MSGTNTVLVNAVGFGSHTSSAVVPEPVDFTSPAQGAVFKQGSTISASWPASAGAADYMLVVFDDNDQNARRSVALYMTKGAGTSVQLNLGAFRGRAKLFVSAFSQSWDKPPPVVGMATSAPLSIEFN